MPPQSEPPTSSQPWKTHDGDTARMAIVTTTTTSAAIAHGFTSPSLPLINRAGFAEPGPCRD